MLGRKKARQKKRHGFYQDKKQIQPDSQLGDLCMQPAGVDDFTREPAESTVVTQELKKANTASGQASGRQDVAEVGTASVIGSRKSQQDAVFGYVSDGQAIGIVCDGMGGLNGGEAASRTALESLADAWFAQTDAADIPAFFRREAMRADRSVYELRSADGRRLEAGTTVVAAIVQRSGLYWLSVGDSKLYVIRGQDMVSLNVEHNYRMELNRMLRQGRLTAQEYADREPQAEALTSYLGIGELSLMDISPKAYPLEDGDIILLASDGLYRGLNEEEILAIVRKNAQNAQKTAEALTGAVKGRKKQDNTSVVVLRYRSERNP